jgi:hypothetical protein
VKSESVFFSKEVGHNFQNTKHTTHNTHFVSQTSYQTPTATSESLHNNSRVSLQSWNHEAFKFLGFQ